MRNDMCCFFLNITTQKNFVLNQINVKLNKLFGFFFFNGTMYLYLTFLCFICVFFDDFVFSFPVFASPAKKNTHKNLLLFSLSAFF